MMDQSYPQFMPVLVLIPYAILSVHVTFCRKQSFEHMEKCNIYRGKEYTVLNKINSKRSSSSNGFVHNFSSEIFWSKFST